ncbi:recombinase RecT [Polynucleobacter sp.]|uniref:recombinase RecT n=1 Tax=Polynucleobacter sp. TaxID=2029855 RepID=UPI003F69F91F
MANVTNSLVQKEKTFSEFITDDLMKKKIMNVISGKDGERFISSIVSAVSGNPSLGGCDHNTILSAALLGEGLKLSPSPQLGQFYMVPFNDRNNGRKVATFVLGYKGYIQLAIRSGYYKKINVLAIKEGELVHYDPMNEEIKVNLIEDDEARENAPTVGFYGMFEYMNGFRKTIYWSKKKMEAHAQKYSKAYQSDLKNKSQYSFWSSDFDGMGFKTILRQLISKWGIMSVDMQKGIDADTNSEPAIQINDLKPETQTQVQEAFFNEVSNVEASNAQ